jgi:PKD domain-containing protein/carboxypeptidase family protein
MVNFAPQFRQGPQGPQGPQGMTRFVASIWIAAALTVGSGCGDGVTGPSLVTVLRVTIPGGGSSAIRDQTPVSFDASGSSGSRLTYTLAYGDGSTDGPQSAPTFTHIYRSSGTFAAVLTVTDQSGRTGTDTKSVVVADALFALSGAVIDIATRKAISGASVSAAGQITTTDSSGNYSLRLSAGTYSVTFAASGYSSAVVTIAIAGDTAYQSTLAINTPNPPTTSNLTGTWSGAGSYPNAPFQLFLHQSGNSIVGYYKDSHDGGPVTGTFVASGFTLVVDFGDGALRLECSPITNPRQGQGVQRTSALGNIPYPFTMTR